MQTLKLLGLPSNALDRFRSHKLFIVFQAGHSIALHNHLPPFIALSVYSTFCSRMNWAVSSGNAVLTLMPDPISNPATWVSRGIILKCHR